MSLTQYSVSWNSYKQNLTKGFACLQQNAEFVDMTLAAEGHIVKVHQNIVALASPYLKHVIRATHCQHPVIFLCNISHNVLTYLVEYIYTGEVIIPAHMVNAFSDACKVLQISGVEDFAFPKTNPTEPTEATHEIAANQTNNNYAAHITIDPQDYHVQVNPMQVNTDDNINRDSVDPNIIIEDANQNGMDIETTNCPPAIPMSNGIQSYILEVNSNVNATDNNIVYENQDNGVQKASDEGAPTEKITSIKLKSGVALTLPATTVYEDSVPQYSISTRGSLQMILNRFMYYCHHDSNVGRKRRWRCIDYRRIRCTATVDTIDDVIIDKVEVHNHPNHAGKIQKKSRKKMLFHSFHLTDDFNGDDKNKKLKTQR